MVNFRLGKATLSMKLFATLLICIIGLTYITFVVQKWVDTGEWPFMVAEGYQYMEYIELTDQAHLYLPYYSLFLFAGPVILLMLTGFSENIKRFFAVFPFMVIAVDITSIFLIPYVWKGFALLLWLTGTVLGITLFTLFIMVLYDIWLRKQPAARMA